MWFFKALCDLVFWGIILFLCTAMFCAIREAVQKARQAKPPTKN